MKQTIIIQKWLIAFLLFAIAVLTGILFTFLTPPSSTNNNGTDMDMMLKTFDVPKGKPAPTLSFTIIKEPDANEWDLHILTTNFTFTPDKIGEKPIFGEGHVHLFIDGKLYVVLGSWFHIDTLSKGAHTILVRLANNDHSTYVVNGNYIQSNQNLLVR